ncbi:Uncharacterized protein APZ42_012966 [Daphnia magna]|uniref:Uncharacterized protein n=1 Tax=Daphnia magna TaxID=35525 RepID=A0A162RAV3_9CRUS|nr:Uncharacterized protein APZ42_012966 [Daphnia magna]
MFLEPPVQVEKLTKKQRATILIPLLSDREMLNCRQFDKQLGKFYTGYSKRENKKSCDIALFTKQHVLKTGYSQRVWREAPQLPQYRSKCQIFQNFHQISRNKK